MPDFHELTDWRQWSPVREDEMYLIRRIGRLDKSNKKRGAFGTDTQRAMIETDTGWYPVTLYHEHDYIITEAGYDIKEGICDTPIPVMLKLQQGGKSGNGGYRIDQVQDKSGKWQQVTK